MGDLAALRAALDLMHVPSRLRHARAEPLPDGIVLLLRLAAGDREAEALVSKATERPPEVLRDAATFYIDQILLTREADSYRVLGVPPDAPAADLRRNMALLLQCLHPDHVGGGQRSLLAGRVTRAWNDLKTPERRAAYDIARPRPALVRPTAAAAASRASAKGPGAPTKLKRWAGPPQLRSRGLMGSGPGLLARTINRLLGRSDT